MPYKDKAKQKQFQHQNYLDRKQIWRERRRKQRKSQQEWFRNLKKLNPCSICGETHIWCIDFHHILGGRDAPIGTLSAEVRSRKKILEELKKCIAVCSNCHRKIHAGDLLYKYKEIILPLA